MEKPPNNLKSLCCKRWLETAYWLVHIVLFNIFNIVTVKPTGCEVWNVFIILLHCDFFRKFSFCLWGLRKWYFKPLNFHISTGLYKELNHKVNRKNAVLVSLAKAAVRCDWLKYESNDDYNVSLCAVTIQAMRKITVIIGLLIKLTPSHTQFEQLLAWRILIGTSFILRQMAITFDSFAGFN